MTTHDSYMLWIGNDLLAFAIALLLTGVLIPRILLIAFRKKLFDEIDERKIHRAVVPRLGGIAFFPAILFSLALVIGGGMRCGWEPMFQQMSVYAVPVIFEVCAIVLIFLVGMADDLVGVRYMAKFVVQILSAILLVSSGLYIHNLYGLCWIHNLPPWFGWLVTGFIVVYVVNAINLIDGIDGLASGLSTIALAFYAVVFFNGQEYVFSMLAAAGAGTLLPFFYYNVFGDPAKQKKIFMGDTGALTIGMVLVFCAVAVMGARPDFLTVDYNPAIVALSPLAVPCFDVFRVYFHRVRKKRNPFLPDKCHIHHKFLALGFNQRASLLLILAISLLFIAINVLLSPSVNPTLLLIADIALWTLANMGLTHAIRRRERSLGRSLYD